MCSLVALLTYLGWPTNLKGQQLAKSPEQNLMAILFFFLENTLFLVNVVDVKEAGLTNTGVVNEQCILVDVLNG